MRKSFGDVCAVDGVSFEVGGNEIVGLLGPNGAGKTTTINMVLGILEPSAGAITITGLDLARHRARALSVTNFAAVYAPMPGNLSVRECLRFFGMIYAVPKLDARVEELIAQFDLARFRDTRCGVLSSGEQTRVALAKSMLNRPRLLLLDEPTASLDPATAQDIRAMIRDIARDTDTGVLWTSHNMYEVEDVCDRVLFVSKGRIVVEGQPSALLGEHRAETLEELFIRLARNGHAKVDA
ncbi:MAG TPA: ABC transporter ATP-binding protein [Nevskiaceae bacterium]|nr:ABC transporter ATP-binding protein [Nevskiaceae bacterium]